MIDSVCGNYLQTNWWFRKDLETKNRFELTDYTNRVFASGTAEAVLAATLLFTEDKAFVESCRDFVQKDRERENLLR